MTKLGTIGTIRITKGLKDLIDLHHRQYGNKEWSGLLFYRHTGGSFTSTKDLKFVADSFYLMDVGSGTLTEHNYDEEAVVKAYDVVPGALEALMGNIHTHHSMGAFHSGTDMGDLEKNAKTYGFYISLVVDTKDTYKCKVAIPAQPSVLTMIDASGKERKIKNTLEPVVLIGDLDVLMPTVKVNIPEWATDRIKELEEAAKAIIRTPTYTGSSFGRGTGYAGYSGYSGYPSTTSSVGRGYGSGYASTSQPVQTSMFGDTTGTTTKETTSIMSYMDEFIIDLTGGGDVGITSVEESLQYLSKVSDTELNELLLHIDANIEIMHFNIWGSIYTYERHLSEVIKELESYSMFKQLKEVINKLKEIEEENVPI